MSAGRPNTAIDTVDVHYFSYKNNSVAHLWLNDAHLSSSMNVTLYDKLTQTSQDMRANTSYTFTHNVNNQNDRFLLIIGNTTIGIGENNDIKEELDVFVSNEELVIRSGEFTGAAQLTLYDMSGRTILNRTIDVNEGSDLRVGMFGLSSAVYTAEITYEGKTKIVKVIKR
jgi:hypothetical protein